jgi:hypothetical protein
MSCPCPDEGCRDVHAHDVTSVLAMQVDIPALIGGLLEGEPGVD